MQKQIGRICDDISDDYGQTVIPKQTSPAQKRRNQPNQYSGVPVFKLLSQTDPNIRYEKIHRDIMKEFQADLRSKILGEETTSVKLEKLETEVAFYIQQSGLAAFVSRSAGDVRKLQSLLVWITCDSFQRKIIQQSLEQEALNGKEDQLPFY